MLDVDPAAVTSMAGCDTFGFPTGLPTGLTPQIGDGPLAPSLFELGDGRGVAMMHDIGFGHGGSFHPEVAGACAGAAHSVAALHDVDVVVDRAGVLPSSHSGPTGVPRVDSVVSVEHTAPAPAAGVLAAPELPEFPEAKRRRKQTRVPAAKRDEKYYAHRAKNTAKAKAIRDRKKAERTAAKARLDNANDRNRRLRAAAQKLESVLEQLKARAGGAQ